MGLVEAENELLKRDRILDAITKIAAHLMAAPSLDAALPAALQHAGEAVAADRVVVLEGARAPDGSLLVNERGAWNAPGVEPQVRAGDMAGRPEVASPPGTRFRDPRSWPDLYGVSAHGCKAPRPNFSKA